MTTLPSPPAPTGAPLEVGTHLVWNHGTRLLSPSLLCGGSPWRLLRLPDGAETYLRQWQKGAAVTPDSMRLARTLVSQGFLHPRLPANTHLDDIDVVIPVRDDIIGLTRLLSALVGFRVTVVDDGSRGGATIADLCARHGATLHRRDVNEGPAAARNVGSGMGTRPFVWFLDADVQMANAPDVASRLLGAMADPLVGAVAPRIRGREGHHVRDRFEARHSPLDRGPFDAVVRPGSPVSFVPSACLLVRREALGDGFDPSLRVGEDVDFVWRLGDAGWLVNYLASVVVFHPSRGTWRGWWQQRVAYGASAGALAARHGERLAPWRSDPRTLAAWGLLAVGQPVMASRVLQNSHAKIKEQLGDDDPTGLASVELMMRGPLRAGAPLARALVRSVGLGLLLVALHPRARKRALGVFALGTLWRFEHDRPRASDLLLAIVDDVAYSVGLWRGALAHRTLVPLTPTVSLRR